MDQSITARLFDVILNDWIPERAVSSSAALYTSLKKNIDERVEDHLALHFAFPVSPSDAFYRREAVKRHADFAEYYAIRNLLVTLRKLEAIYPLGIEFSICFNYVDYEDDESEMSKGHLLRPYVEGLREIITSLGGEDVIVVVASKGCCQKGVPNEDSILAVEDVSINLSDQPIDPFKLRELSVRLCNDDGPWRYSICYDSLTGKMLMGEPETFLAHESQSVCYLPVTYRGKRWFYASLQKAVGFETAAFKTALKMEIIRPGCGLFISSVDPSLSFDCIETRCLTELIKEFGLTIFRGFRKILDEREFIAKYSKRTPNGMVPWKFGYVHKVKIAQEPGFVNTSGGLPIHFDMNDPPSYMGIDRNVYKFEDFVPREFVLNCISFKCGEQNGATTFIDAHTAALSLPSAKADTWKALRLVYCNKVTSGEKQAYFGGNGFLHGYQLVDNCPWTGRLVLRWCESWVTKDHPDTAQEQDYIVELNGSTISSSAVTKEIRELAFDSRFFFKHHYQAGDMVFVNNYTMLHGREAFSGSRELWRIQAIPPSVNTPDYFLTYGKKYSVPHTSQQNHQAC